VASKWLRLSLSADGMPTAWTMARSPASHTDFSAVMAGWSPKLCPDAVTWRSRAAAGLEALGAATAALPAEAPPRSAR
jgi:hypothetical protein